MIWLLLLIYFGVESTMASQPNSQDLHFYKEALLQAKKSLNEGGIPIGSVLVCDGKIIGKGHNHRIQSKSAIRHGEMDAIESAGRLSAATYQSSLQNRDLR
jgi:cytosine deaminase